VVGSDFCYAVFHGELVLFGDFEIGEGGVDIIVFFGVVGGVVDFESVCVIVVGVEVLYEFFYSFLFYDFEA
jgi:hypothetical protein